MSKTNNKYSLETGMLSFARSIQVSEGLFFARPDNAESAFVPVEVHEKGVRGQSSDDRSTNPGKSNPQTVEFAVVPQGSSAIELRFTIRILPNSIKPHACDMVEVDNTYREVAKVYQEAGGYEELAQLYIWNILNGRFAWRNRYQTDESKVVIEFEGCTLGIDPTEVSLETPPNLDDLAKKLLQGNKSDLKRLAERFTESLTTHKKPLTLAVSWQAMMQPGQEIFPSQEYLRDDKKVKELSRVYAKLPAYRDGRLLQQASMHSQKINAAIRHVDLWHNNSEYHAIAVNPYAGVQETSEVLRNQKTKNSFYDIRKDAQGLIDGIRSASSATTIPGNAHFFMANLIRGGVFSAKKKTAKKNGDPT